MDIQVAIPDSLKKSEQVISTIHKTLTEEGLDRVLKISDSDSSSPGIHVAHITLSESDCSHLNFLSRYYARLGSSNHLNSHYFISNNDSPKLLELTTTRRLEFVQACRALAGAFDGRPIKLSIDTSWTWDRDVLQPDGSSTHRTIFQLRIILGQAKAFNAAQWLKYAFDGICLAKDERADKCMFQHFRATTGEDVRSGSYEFNNQGVKMCFSSKEHRDLAIKKSFQGCEVNVLKRDEHELYPLEVIFPE